MLSMGLTRHQTIENIIVPDTENVADAAISLWGKMSIQIISIVGEAGFDSLYARSLFLTQASFPWLTIGSRPPSDPRFSELRMNFEGQSPAQIRATNNMLLITFTDILASLIGEPLTSSILRSAWGNHTSNGSGKES
jgi:hypothetical protein